MGTYDLDMLNVDINRSKKRLNRSTIGRGNKKTSNSWLLFNLLILVINIGSFVVYFYTSGKDNVIDTLEEEILYLLGFVLIVNLLFLFMSVISATSSSKRIRRNKKSREFRIDMKKDTDFFYLDRGLIA